MPKAKRSPTTAIANAVVGQTNVQVVNGRVKGTGRFAPGFSGSPGGDAARARRALNLDTLQAMHEAFREHGRQAIEKVAKTQPAMFLKMLVLLVPRELEVTHSQGVKGMSDEQIEATITAIERYLAEKAKTVDVTPRYRGSHS